MIDTPETHAARLAQPTVLDPLRNAEFVEKLTAALDRAESYCTGGEPVETPLWAYWGVS